MSKAEQDIRRKRRLFEYAERTDNIRKTCRRFGMHRSLFYVRRNAYRREGESGLDSLGDEQAS